MVQRGNRACAPLAMTARLNGEINKALADPAVAALVANTGQVVSPGTPDEFARSIDEQLTAFTAIGKALDRQPAR